MNSKPPRRVLPIKVEPHSALTGEQEAAVRAVTEPAWDPKYVGHGIGGPTLGPGAGVRDTHTALADRA